MVPNRRRPSIVSAALATVICAGLAPAPGRAAPIESGTASWYGGRHIGRATSSGEAFSATDLTAAHPYLPLGTHVRVTMPETGSSVVVRINDRQPPHGHRVIDLSREAASQLGMLGRGTAPVTIELAAAEEVEVAMAPDDETAVSAPRHGRRHRRHAHR